ncbi:ankyrin repeat, SAM and basic leucine zipper domain-containing protein 1-like isoform X1 [Mytilus californianus]|uniref:ankyrin repeat, SAM and basic leucine zipper domain-containing protein 1-like isoform X1 n=1 Tax=Mytilus californianus TaxID=6549 RepID=UPI00224714ED|nr:ankyrin repeat, SAM and basic leucine zipper domain-containing protein 1-like isoform X1 [Mytilus californianus]
MASTMDFFPGGAEDDFDDDDDDGFILGCDNNHINYDHAKISQWSNEDTNNNFQQPDNVGKGGFGAPQRKSAQKNVPDKANQKRPVNRKLGVDDFRMAITRGNMDIITESVANGFDVNTVLKCGWTGLMYAANSANKQIVEFLVNKGANVKCHHDMFNVLMAACSSTISKQENILSCVTILIGAGADVNSHDRYHMSPLIYAAREGRELIVTKLLGCGANINKQDSRGWSALSWSVSKNHVKVVKVLLDHGADISMKQCDGQTPLDLAVSQQYDELAALLGGEVKRKSNHLEASNIESQKITNGEVYDDEPDNDSQSVIKYGELELFLCGLDLSRFVSLFQQQHLDFTTVLQMTDEDLIKMGIHQIGVRKKILDGIRTVHKKEWETTSLQQVQYNKQISCAESIAMVANISKHCKYIGSTTGYIRDQILKNPEILDVQDGTGPELLLQHTDDTMKNVQSLYTELQKLNRTLNLQLKRKDFNPPDLVTLKKKKSGFRKRRLISVCCVTFIVGLAWWKKQPILDFLSQYDPADRI